MTVEIPTGSIEVDVRRNAQARRLILRIPHGGQRPVITVPQRARDSVIRGFLAEKAEWLARQMESLPRAVAAEDMAVIPVRGMDHRLLHHPERRGAVRIEAGDPPGLLVPGETDALHRKITDWLKRLARSDLSEAVSRHTRTLGVRSGRLSVRDTASRWGSCASSGDLSFSWRLIMAPPHVLNYVAAHEVAHLKEMNHGPRFWAHVARLDPEMETARKWLRNKGGALHGILPKAPTGR